MLHLIFSSLQSSGSFCCFQSPCFLKVFILKGTLHGMEERQQCVHFCLDATTASTAHVKSLKQHRVLIRRDKKIYQPTLHEKKCYATQHKQNQSRVWKSSVFACTLLNSQHSAQHKIYTNLLLWLWIASPDGILCYGFPCGKWGICYVISEVSKLTKSVCPRGCWMINIHGERFWCGRGYVAQCRNRTNTLKNRLLATMN